MEPAPVAEPSHIASDSTAPVVLCESCGGPTTDGALCASCERAFQSVFDKTTPAAPDLSSAPAVTGPEPDEPSPLFEWMQSNASPAAGDIVSPAEMSSPAPVLSEMATAQQQPPEGPERKADQTRAAESEAVKAEAPPKADAIKTETTRTEAPRAAKAQPKPAVAGKRPGASASPPGRSRSGVLVVAAVVLVAAIGLPSAYWFEIRRPPQVAREEQPEQPTPSTIPVTTERVAKVRETASAPPQAAPTVKPKAATAALPSRTERGRVPPKPVRQPDPAPRQVASVVAPSPAIEALAPVAPPPPPPPAAAQPSPSIPAAAPAGKVFEVSDVDSSPQVATRVEPQVPGDLQGRSLNDIVVVRVLVSQTGHPFRVSLLRRSRVGPSLDDAVVAAVTRWTFSPARKRGEAVSCWYNLGVPLGRAQ